jgi:hypothetical protein
MIFNLFTYLKMLIIYQHYHHNFSHFFDYLNHMFELIHLFRFSLNVDFSNHF